MAKTPPIKEYIQIYHEFYVLSWSVFDISKKHACSDDKVWDALKYVDKKLLSLSNADLLRGSVYSVRARLKSNKLEANKILGKVDSPNYSVYIGLNREIRADEELMNHLLGQLENSRELKRENEISMPGTERWLERKLKSLKLKEIREGDS